MCVMRPAVASKERPIRGKMSMCSGTTNRASAAFCASALDAPWRRPCQLAPCLLGLPCVAATVALRMSQLSAGVSPQAIDRRYRHGPAAGPCGWNVSVSRLGGRDSEAPARQTPQSVSYTWSAARATVHPVRLRLPVQSACASDPVTQFSQLQSATSVSRSV